MARPLGLSAAALSFGLALACSSSLPTPETKAHPSQATKFVDVPYPPPAAHVEIVPPKPREGAVWVDGEWTWQGRQWAWELGGWVMPPPNAYFSPWIVFRQKDGKLVFAPGSWHREDGQPLPKPVPLVPAQTSLEIEQIEGPGSADGGT
jgi:hypothetical protein